MPKGWPHAIKAGARVEVTPDDPGRKPYLGEVQYILQPHHEDPSPSYFIRADDGCAYGAYEHQMRVMTYPPEVTAAIAKYHRSPAVSVALANYERCRAAFLEGSNR